MEAFHASKSRDNIFYLNTSIPQDDLGEGVLVAQGKTGACGKFILPACWLVAPLAVVAAALVAGGGGAGFAEPQFSCLLGAAGGLTVL